MCVSEAYLWVGGPCAWATMCPHLSIYCMRCCPLKTSWPMIRVVAFHHPGAAFSPALSPFTHPSGPRRSAVLVHVSPKSLGFFLSGTSFPIVLPVAPPHPFPQNDPRFSPHQSHLPDNAPASTRLTPTSPMQCPPHYRCQFPPCGLFWVSFEPGTL